MFVSTSHSTATCPSSFASFFPPSLIIRFAHTLSATFAVFKHRHVSPLVAALTTLQGVDSNQIGLNFMLELFMFLPITFDNVLALLACQRETVLDPHSPATLANVPTNRNRAFRPRLKSKPCSITSWTSHLLPRSNNAPEDSFASSARAFAVITHWLLNTIIDVHTDSVSGSFQG